MSTLPSILVVDDEERGLQTIERILGEEFDVYTATSAEDAAKILQREWIQVLLCDHRMPKMSGVEFCTQVRTQWPEVVRIILSGYTDSADIIEAINKGGIYQFIAKPWNPEELLLHMRNAVALSKLQRENEQLSVELKIKPESLSESLIEKRRLLQARFSGDMGIVRSLDSSMNNVCDLVQRIAPFDVSVLLQGESGTGKELCARALHYNSLRQNAAFIAENCGAMPDELLESELFGHKRGAFTGAVEDKVGLLELADGGTIFFDEIGDISPAFQIKLLRVLQEGEIRPVGSNRRRRIDVRVVAASNKDLMEEVRAGRFRMDLYYRLSTFTLPIPPLRERAQDINPLANALLRDIMPQLGKQVKGFSREAISCFESYQWPGNVRQLQNEIKRMLVLTNNDTLGAELISPQIIQATPDEAQASMAVLEAVAGSLKERVEFLEATILKETLIRLRWNKTRAAQELGLSRVGLRSKLQRYELYRADDKDKLIETDT